MKYAYEDLSDDQFETLVVLVCQRLLGISVQGFAKGPDGGRDARFTGVAELHPSTASPWADTTIIQAKHTNGHNRNFSEKDFYSEQSNNTVIGKELDRIKALREANELDHYILFANRRLTALADTEIKKHISTECGIPIEDVYLCGVEQLEILLKRFPDIATEAELDPIDSPLIVSPDELAEVVQAFHQHKNGLKAVLDDPPTERVRYETKNRINNMSAEYARSLRKKYLKETGQIRTFLAAPENLEILRCYESVVDEFELKIIAKRKHYQRFDDVMEYLLDLLYNRDPVLRQKGHKRLTRAMLFYMYWNCDIGEDEDAEAD